MTAQEPERDCTLVRVGGYTLSKRQDSVHYSHRASGGIDYQCTDGTRILADSAVVWERSGSALLVERVHFEDAETELEADTAHYFGNTRELLALSRVTLTERNSGAVLSGDTLSYQRESRFRTMDRIRVHGGSPRAVVYPRPRLEAAPDAPTVDSQADEPSGTPPEEGPAGASPGENAEGGGEAGGGDEQGDGENAEGGEEAGGGENAEGEDPGIREDTLPADTVAPIPYEVDAPRLYVDGRRFFRAGGGVVVTRGSLVATGDSLDYDQQVGAMLILGNAQVVDRGYRLRGVTVSVVPLAGLDEEILAREDAELTGDQVRMRAPAIRLFLGDGGVNHIFALPSVVPLPGQDREEPVDTTGLTPGDVARARALAEAARRAAGDSIVVPDSLPRPTVVAADFVLTGDSIEVQSPKQLLDLVTAVGRARAEAMNPESAPGEELPKIARSDWIEGRRIVARFGPEDPAEDTLRAPHDTTSGRVRLESVTAITEARSLYRVSASDTAREEPDTAREDSDTATTGSESVAEVSDGADPETEIAGAESAIPPDAAGMGADESGVPPAAADTLQGEGTRPPALHYVRGNRITIHMEGRTVVRMEVEGQTVGYHLEPLPPDTLPVVRDSLAVPGDTVGTAVDGADADTTVADTDTVPTASDSTRIRTAAPRETPSPSGIGGLRRGGRPFLRRRRTGARR